LSIDEYFLLPSKNEAFSFKKKWLTEILTAIDGNEQRSALLTWPRRSLTIASIALTSSDLNYIKRIFFKKLHLTWGIPFYQDRTVLTSQAASGQKTLNVESTQYRNFEIGAPCILLESKSSFEPGTIASFNDTQITFEENLASTWPVSTPVYPVLQAKIMAEQEMNLHNPSFGEIFFTATEDYSEGISRYSPDVSMFPVYKELPVFHIRPEQGSLKQILFHPYQYLVFLGKSYSESHWAETAHRLKGHYHRKGREDTWNLLNFFDDQKGRWGNFYLPTWNADIIITESFGAGDTVLTIDPIEYPTYWAGSQTPRHVALLWPDDTPLICREIINAGSNTITLDSAIGKASGDPGLLFVSFLLMARLDIDEIEMSIMMDGENDAERLTIFDLSFHSLPQETPA